MNRKHEFQGEGWMDRQDFRGKGGGGAEASGKEQVKEGAAAINTMTHSFCDGHFLTAFIKANLIILAR